MIIIYILIALAAAAVIAFVTGSLRNRSLKKKLAQGEISDILYTMRDDEVAGWVRSLQLRGVPLPDALKDEVFLIIGERRFDHA